MADPLLIPCPRCNGLNRIPAERLADHPKCGRCKREVPLSQPFELNQLREPDQGRPAVTGGRLGRMVRAVQILCPGFRPGCHAVGGQVPPGQAR